MNSECWSISLWSNNNPLRLDAPHNPTHLLPCMISFWSPTKSEYWSVLICRCAGYWFLQELGCYFCCPLSLSIAKRTSGGTSSSGTCDKTGVARYLEKHREPQLHSYLSPFPQGALRAWTTAIWAAIELSRIIGFYSASGAFFFKSSCPTVKALPHAHHL